MTWLHARKRTPLHTKKGGINTEALVIARRNQAVCDSLEVAERFGKEHRNILQSIDGFTAENSAVKTMFLPAQYKANNGQEYRKYFMNRDGFSLLVMGFTGKEALRWKLEYIAAFNRMEDLLRQKQTPVYQALRGHQIEVRKKETDAIKSFVEYAAAQGSEHAKRYYTSLSRLADKAADIESRDAATVEQLSILSTVEHIIACCLLEGMELEEPYRDIYTGCKIRLERFRAIAYLSGS